MTPYTGQEWGGYYGHGHGGYGHQPYVNQNYQGAPHRPAQHRLPFLATLNLPDLSRLTNDLVSYDPTWPAIPMKLPLDIPKFEGKLGEDPSEHVITFHLWCSSNSLHEDSIYLRLFQRTLTGACREMVHRAAQGGICFVRWPSYDFSQPFPATSALRHWYWTLVDISAR